MTKSARSGAVTPLWRMYGFPNGYTADAVVIAALSNAKAFTRRLDITYDDLVVVAPDPVLQPARRSDPEAGSGWACPSWRWPSSGKRTISRPTSGSTGKLAGKHRPDPAGYRDDIKGWVKDPANYGNIMGLITLAIPAGNWTASKQYARGDFVRPKSPPAGSTLFYECTVAGTSSPREPGAWPATPGSTCKDGTVVWTCMDESDAGCFGKMAFRYADPAKMGQPIAAVEYIRLLRFIRLWKKLGWTIEQTDAAICGLYPLLAGTSDFESRIDSLAELDKGLQVVLLRLGILSKVMRSMDLTPDRDLLSLLACWSDIYAHGDHSLYRKMFLNPTLLKLDPVFDDNGFGGFLQKADVRYVHREPRLAPAIASAVPDISYDSRVKKLSYASVMDTRTYRILGEFAQDNKEFREAIDALYGKQRLFTHSEALRSGVQPDRGRVRPDRRHA